MKELTIKVDISVDDEAHTGAVLDRIQHLLSHDPNIRAYYTSTELEQEMIVPDNDDEVEEEDEDKPPKAERLARMQAKLASLRQQLLEQGIDHDKLLEGQ